VSFWTRDARAFAEALFSGPSGPPPAERLDWLMSDAEDFVAEAGPRVLAIFAGGLAAASLLAPPLVGRLGPLWRLSLEDRCRALERMEATPLGLPLLAVKAMLCILYYEHPDALRDIGVLRGTETSPACMVTADRPGGGATR
jgi:hypothetical protein